MNVRENSTKALIIGGKSMADQIKVLERGADVLIATPERLLDVFDRGRLLLNDVRILVIDEADRMLDMGFIPDVERIVSLVSRIRQTLLFSATMPLAIRQLADAFLSNPKQITVAPPATPVETVEQGLVVAHGGLKEKQDKVSASENGIPPKIRGSKRRGATVAHAFEQSTANSPEATEDLSLDQGASLDDFAVKVIDDLIIRADELIVSLDRSIDNVTKVRARIAELLSDVTKVCDAVRDKVDKGTSVGSAVRGDGGRAGRPKREAAQS